MPSYVKAGFERDLRGLIESLESVEVGLGKLVEQVGEEKLDPLTGEVKGLMRFDPAHRGWKQRPGARTKRRDPGHIRDSVRGRARGSTLVIEATHPGSGVQWWGGHIAPKGTVLDIQPKPGTGRDFESRKVAEVGRDLQQAYDRLAREHGL